MAEARVCGSTSGTSWSCPDDQSRKNGFDPSAAAGQSFLIQGTPTTYYITKGRELDYTPGEVTKAILDTNIRQLFGVS